VKRAVSVLLVALVIFAALLLPPATPPSHSQGTDVYLNVTQGGQRKLGIAIPEFTRQGPPDEGNFSRAIPEIIGNDLRFSGLFAVVANEPPLPPAGDLLKQRLAALASSGAHAAMQGAVVVAGQRVTVDFRIYDLTNPAFTQIAAKTFWAEPLRHHRGLAHRIADELVYTFTGERGIAETQIAYVVKSGQNKEIWMSDYDGFNEGALTNLASLSLSPVWSPTDRSIAFTSYFQGYPFLYRMFPFNPRQRGPLLLSAWPGINTAAAWAPDGRTIALTVSYPGNPEIYTLNVDTSAFQRITNNRGIDTDPSWSPNGREIAFSSDRMGPPQIWVMDAQGVNARRLTTGNYDTQPRWSPRGDQIVFTRRTAAGFDLWSVSPDGANQRALTQGQGSNESASWAPNGRHIVFSSSRGGRPQLYTMLADGTEQQPLTRNRGEASSPTWSPRPQ
jgi:TolB protein